MTPGSKFVPARRREIAAVNAQDPAPRTRYNAADMSSWTFVRHGQSRANAQGWLAGTIDAPLTDLGRAQAEALRDSLLPLPGDCLVHASDLVRASETVRILLAGSPVPILFSPELRERSIGRFSGASEAELEPLGGHALLRRFTGRPPGGESLRDVGKRALTWMSRQRTPTPRLVVCHGALMRAVLGLLDEMALDEIGNFRPKNCEAFTREISMPRIAELLASL